MYRQNIFQCFIFLFKLMQCFLISIHFFLVCKLVSTLSFTKSQFLFTFFTMSVPDKFLIWFIKKKEAKQKNCAVDFLTPFWGKLTLTLIFNMCIQDLVHFVMFETLTFIFLKTLIDIIIFLDILLSLISALFKYLFLTCFT